jgi:hypothetical protein
MMWATMTKNSVSNAGPFIAIADGTTTLAEIGTDTSAGTQSWPISYVFVGDGASHTFKLRFRTPGGTLAIDNTSGTDTPMMTFWMGSAN